MLATVVTSQRKQFTSLAKAWMENGATTYSIWSEGVKLAGWPKNAPDSEASLSASIELNGAELGDIRVTGIQGENVLASLQAEAGLISRMARMERELKGMTSLMIDTQDQLLAVYDLTEATRHHLDIDDLLQQLSFKATQLLTTEGAFFIVYYEKQEQYQTAHYPQPMLDDELIHACLEKVRNTESELLLNLADTEYQKAGLNNLLFVPIRIDEKINAALGLVNKREGDFLTPDTKLARVVASHAGSRIEHLLLYQENLEQTKLQVEADLAQRVQLNLMPKKSPSVDGLDLWGGSRPASQVGGDFYDFVSTPDRPFTFAVGDVSGKGMPAALLMAMTRTVMRTKTNISPTPTPETIMDHTNSELYEDFTEVSMFATAFIGQYHPEERILYYANSGHSPVIFCPADGSPTILEADGTALGVLPTSLAQNQKITFNKGDVLVVATDGFSEAMNGDDELFGYERLKRAIKRHANKSAKAIVEQLYEAINIFSLGQPQSDDQTLIVIKGK